ncbi:hypothetical protein [Actinocrispum wychmicini]|uniref:PknH-like protein n=1 Tax=Actinocrispum wychmicini TaxID=1213861 RepID=A0A4R2JPX5_9PSEU|nr:hypothetical protein [Actinocrispum wychmicini]TCO60832.1 hypothetical protein EV192_103413 [Actinocrispum wychmicini]
MRTWTLVILLAGLTGCATARPAGPPAFTGELDATAVDLATPSGTWRSTQVVLDNAIAHLDRHCMAARGFDYPVRTTPLPPSPEDETAIIDLPGRRTRGYRPEPSTPDTSPGSRPPGYQAALFGPPGTDVPTGIAGGYTVKGQGCEADSRRALVGDVVLWARLTYVPEQVNDRLTAQATSAPGYLSAMAGWRECVAARGFPFQTPDDARHSFGQETGTAAVSQREISVAVADGECAMREHLPLVALRAERDLVASLPDADRKLLYELAAYRAAAVERAQTVVP